MAKQGIIHSDLSWRHVGWKNSKEIIFIDLHRVKMEQNSIIAEKNMKQSLSL